LSRDINKHVARAIVELAVFLEFSGDDAVHPNAAMQALEQLASTLQMMDLDSRSSLCSLFKSIALEYSNEQAEFVDSLGEALGLIDEWFTHQ
jgi:hypothetical protein